jgi:uncharacterized protein
MILEEIWIYPIKSLPGISLNNAKLATKGFQWDRRWMLVDENGLFITQRKQHELALLKVEWTNDGFKIDDRRAPHRSCFLPIHEVKGANIQVTVWDDEVEAQIVDPLISEWFSQFLGFPCHLVKMDEKAARKISSKYAVNEETVSFADAMPYLIAGQSALQYLNEKLEVPVTMQRFRPNLIFSGGDAFAEDLWETIQIGKAHFKVTKPCARCVLVNVDPNTAEVAQEPLKTLNTFRNFNGKVMFGQNLIWISGDEVKVGDQIVGFPK